MIKIISNQNINNYVYKTPTKQIIKKKRNPPLPPKKSISKRKIANFRNFRKLNLEESLIENYF